jgi:trans-aconitate 2-methyltransferase
MRTLPWAREDTRRNGARRAGGLRHRRSEWLVGTSARQGALMAEDWSARQYLKFEDERTRPPRDLLAQVPLQSPRRVVDLGCGPGNSTELLITRYPQADVVGLDSSSDMLRQARERLPYCTFAEADLATWSPPEGTDLLFANAVFQWVPDHPAVLRRLLERLPEGGVLALQMPDNTDEPALALMREVAKSGPWAAEVGLAAAARDDLPTPAAYYDLLKPFCAHLDIWHTVYNHVMAGPDAIVEWFRGSALRPFLSVLNTDICRRIQRAHRPRLPGAFRRPCPPALSAAVHRGDTLGAGLQGRSAGRHGALSNMDALTNRQPSFLLSRAPWWRSGRCRPGPRCSRRRRRV